MLVPIILVWIRDNFDLYILELELELEQLKYIFILLFYKTRWGGGISFFPLAAVAHCSESLTRRTLKTQNPRKRKKKKTNNNQKSLPRDSERERERPWICKRTSSIAYCSSSMHVKLQKPNMQKTLSMPTFVYFFSKSIPPNLLILFLFIDLLWTD